MRIVIVEGSAVLRAGLAQVLDGGGRQVAAAVPGGAALPALVRRHRPDAVVVNAGRPGGGDLVGAVVAARRELPSTAALLYSTAPEPALAARLFADGTRGAGFVLQEHVTEPEFLFDALERVTAGEPVVDPRVVGVLAPLFRPAGPAAGDDLASLSGRERDVLRLMALGRTNSAIADELCVSAGTVEKRAAAVFGKLGLPADDRDNRRVLAVLRYLAARPTGTPAPAPVPVPSLLANAA
ncbi:response regulator transcription factor [Streptomyces racemochromogenes]|uniref:Response regulator transcription factor n=1 Tax=Streptomyces racemochromogenes TaxID=67353 RepID=A0ABW7PLN8_9ACTN